MESGAVRTQQAVAMWSVKQSMDMTKRQMAQNLETLAKAPLASEPGKGTILDVRA